MKSCFALLLAAAGAVAPRPGMAHAGPVTAAEVLGIPGAATEFPAAPVARDTLPRTRAERTDYRETTRYEEVVAIMEAVAAASPMIHLTSFGYTYEGRSLPLAVVGTVADASPEAVKASGKTRVFIQANIHGGEVEGKEAMLMLLRDLATGAHPGWADSLVLLIAPIYNADGNERIAMDNRPLQHGPIGGMGQRPNAQGYDLNRDHMKLDSPEAHSLVRLMNRYDPHVAIDLHATNGTRHYYMLTYSPPLHPNTHPAIVEYLRGKWLPQVTKEIRDRHGWEFYYYGNVYPRGEARGWYTFDHRPRFNNNYVGLRNRIAILSEAYAYATFEERIRATRAFVERLLDFARAHATEIRRLTEQADAAPIIGQELAVRAEPERSAEPVEILLGEAAEERNPFSGQVMLRRLDVRRPERMYEYGTFKPTETARVPRAYLVPAELRDVVAKLEAHGIRMRRLEREATLQVERFRIDSTRVAERPFQGHQERTVWGTYESATVTVPAGTVVVPVDQPLGRLAFMLLEPRSDDGLLNWNVLDRALEGATHYPILRTFAEPPRAANVDGKVDTVGTEAGAPGPDADGAATETPAGGSVR